MKMKIKPPPGHKLVRDWEGKKIRTNREMRTGRMVIPAGTIATVVYCRGGTGLRIESNPCGCCGVKMIIDAVSHNDVDIFDA